MPLAIERPSLVATLPRYVAGLLAGSLCGAACGVVIFVVGLAVAWLVGLGIAWFSSLPVLFYVIVILLGFLLVAVALITWLCIYLFAGAFARGTIEALTRPVAAGEVRLIDRISFVLAAVAAAVLCILAIQMIAGRWSLANLSPELLKIFGQGFPGLSAYAWGWLPWLNLLGGVGAAGCMSLQDSTAAEMKAAA